MADQAQETTDFSEVFGAYGVYLALVLLALTGIWYNSDKGKKPPARGGLLPYIGCAIAFGKAPLWFIEESRKKLGPIFTLKVAGKRLTFLTSPEDFQHFFTSPNVDFQTAVQDPVAHTASVSKESFFKNHTKIHDTVKASLAPGQLQPFCDSLHEKFQQLLTKWGKQEEGELNQLVRATMYPAILDNLFGENTLPTKEGFDTLEKHFVLYDDQFEYGSQLPEMFLKDWSESKWYLLGTFREIADRMLSGKVEKKQETVLTTLFALVDRPHAGNYGLLLMWASLANAIPITFWTLAFILSHEGVAEKVRREIAQVWTPGTAVSPELVSRLVYVKQCVLEAIRLRSPGVITRAVTKPLTVQDYTIPAGDHLMLSPYWAHRNPSNFPEPESFKPERWDAVDVTKNRFLEGFVAFGGGRYQCPGRWFALLEIVMFVAMTMRKYDITLLDPVPQLSPLHLVGTQQPESSLRIHCKERVTS